MNFSPKLSVIIPCYNEINTIEEILERVQDSNVKEKEIVIVDDCSTDGTRDLLRKLNHRSPDLKIIYHDKNLGKGAAISSAQKNISGDIVIIQDADLEYDPSQYPKIIEPIMSGKADVVFGSRFMGGEPHRVVYFWHRIGNGILTTLSNACTNLNLTDMETCYKCFSAEVFNSLKIQERRFGVEPEITAKIARINCRIFEVGISYYGRTYSEGKKINWKDGFRAIYCILKYNFLR